MYRSSVDGLTERVRALEEEKQHLEADLAGMKRIRWPQRAARLALLAAIVGGAAAAGGVLGYRRALIELADASRRNVENAWRGASAWRRTAELCDARLREIDQLAEENEAFYGTLHAARDKDTRAREARWGWRTESP